MLFKKLLILASAALLAMPVAAQTAKKADSKLTNATVFFNGAELTHTASVSLTKGANELQIGGLSPNVDRNSIRLKATGGAVISSYEFAIDYLTAEKESAPTIKMLRDSIVHYQKELDRVTIAASVNSNMIKYLQEGISKNVSGSEKGLGIDELVKTMDYYKSKSEQLESDRIALNKANSELRTSINRLQSQLNQETTKSTKTSGMLKLSVSAPLAGTSEFTVTYFTASAAWTPYYEVNIASTDRPVSFAAKAKVRQTTGIDWNRVKLTLSTAMPSNGKVAPLFSTWFLEQQRVYARAEKSMDMAMQNSYAYADEMPEVVVMGMTTMDKRTFSGSVSSMPTPAPIAVLNGEIVPQSVLDQLDQSTVKSIETLTGKDAKAAYGSRASGGAIVVTTKSATDYVQASDNELNAVYEIDTPYTIPGTGKDQSIALFNKDAAAEYKYYCAPKLDNETYLLAEIPQWNKLGLISGVANVTYDGTYIGETYIDAWSTQEKLALTLGADKRVVVKREKLQDFSSTRTIGSDITQVFTYKITVRNNQNKPVKMVLKDQYPRSTQKNIVVELRKETTPWTVNNEEVGVITWEEEISAGATKTYQISYSVKYPKDMTLNL